MYVKLIDSELLLKPISYFDKSAWDQVRALNQDWLMPLEASKHKVDPFLRTPSFIQMVRLLNKERRAGRSISFGIFLNSKKKFIGQITLGGITYGALRGAHIGYWIDKRYSGKGFITRAVKMVSNYGFEKLNLHRIEIAMRPENEASKKVAIKAGYKFEGERKNFLHIAGQWRNHMVFVLENPKIQ
jgi:ribosomal-protein-alanine N-acetyltransferase